MSKLTCTEPKFQFHKGTIRTEEANARANIASNFNSIKVRLEQKSHYPYQHKNQFQFHKGTIRTAEEHGPQSISEISIP